MIEFQILKPISTLASRFDFRSFHVTTTKLFGL